MSLARQRLFTLLFVPGVLAFAFILVACGSPQIQIQSPAKNSSVAGLGTPLTCPVNVSTKWTGAILTAPTLALDGISVTNALAINGTATITAPPGPHTIVVNGTIVINNGATNVADSSSFTITPPPPTIILSPSGGVSVQADGTGTIKVTTSMPLANSLNVTKPEWNRRRPRNSQACPRIQNRFLDSRIVC